MESVGALGVGNFGEGFSQACKLAADLGLDRNTFM